MHRALLLNASGEPLSIVRDRDAVVLTLAGLADPIEDSGRLFRSPSIAVPVPSVLQLRRYIPIPAHHRSVMLTTANVLARDGYECAYCGGRADTMDHITPRAAGGPHAWENVTAACRPCNAKKGDKSLAEVGFHLRRAPYRPRGVVAHLMRSRVDPTWVPYLATVG